MENICSSVSRDANSRLFCFYPPNRRRGDRNTNTGGVRFIHRSWLLNLLKPRNTLPRRFEGVTQRTVKKDATYNTIKSSSHCGSRQLFCKTCKNDATICPVWKLRSNRSNVSAKFHETATFCLTFRTSHSLPYTRASSLSGNVQTFDVS